MFRQSLHNILRSTPPRLFSPLQHAGGNSEQFSTNGELVRRISPLSRVFMCSSSFNICFLIITVHAPLLTMTNEIADSYFLSSLTGTCRSTKLSWPTSASCGLFCDLRRDPKSTSCLITFTRSCCPKNLVGHLGTEFTICCSFDLRNMRLWTPSSRDSRQKHLSKAVNDSITMASL